MPTVLYFLNIEHAFQQIRKNLQRETCYHEDVAADLLEKFGIPLQYQGLYFKGKRIKSFNIQDQDMLTPISVIKNELTPNRVLQIFYKGESKEYILSDPEKKLAADLLQEILDHQFFKFSNDIAAIYNGILLSPLVDFGDIEDNSVITLIDVEDFTMGVIISFKNSVKVLNVSPNLTVKELKLRISRLFSINSQALILECEDRQLNEEGKTLSEYSIEDQAIIEVSELSIGGAEWTGFSVNFKEPLNGRNLNVVRSGKAWKKIRPGFSILVVCKGEDCEIANRKAILNEGFAAFEISELLTELECCYCKRYIEREDIVGFGFYLTYWAVIGKLQDSREVYKQEGSASEKKHYQLFSEGPAHEWSFLRISAIELASNIESMNNTLRSYNLSPTPHLKLPSISSRNHTNVFSETNSARNSPFGSPVSSETNIRLRSELKEGIEKAFSNQTLESPLLRIRGTKVSVKNSGIVEGYAVNTHEGQVRKTNEDRVSISVNIQKPKNKINEIWPKCSYFGVFDGHGGKACASFLKETLHEYIVSNPNFPADPKLSIEEAFAEADQDFLEEAEESHERAGSCAVVVLIVGADCYVANLGDSRAILSIEKGTDIQALTRDHKAGDSEEKERVLRAGGNVYETNYRFKKKKEGVMRILPGHLAVSRAFGDIDAKFEEFGGKTNVLISVPEIEVFRIGKMHDFIVVGSDGIFDCLENREVVDVVWSSAWSNRRNYENSMVEAVEEIMMQAIRRNSADNLTVVLISLNGLRSVHRKEKTLPILGVSSDY